MNKPIRILLAEDSEDDALLLEHVIKKGGYEPEIRWIEDPEAMVEALEKGDWDMVLCDYAMPSFNGLDALNLVKNSGHDLPFIIVSGAIGEETAVGLMKAGAHDYVFKGNLARLVPAIERELRDAEVRSLHHKAEGALKESEARYQELFDSVMEGIGLVDENEVIQLCNPAYARIFGEDSVNDLIGKSLLDYVVEDQRGLILSQTEIRKSNRTSQYEVDIVTAKNHRKTILASVSPRFHKSNRYVGAFGAIMDITERKRAEEELQESEERYKDMVENAGVAICVDDENGNVTYFNQEFADLFGYSIEEMKKHSHKTLVHTDDVRIISESLKRHMQGEKEPSRYEFRGLKKDGSVIHLEVVIGSVLTDSGSIIGIRNYFWDITERKWAEEALRKTTDELRAEREELTEKNLVLKHILEHIEGEREEYKQQICQDVEQVVIPVLTRLQEQVDPSHAEAFEALQENLKAILAKDIDVFRERYARLTPRELEICDLIKEGSSSKEISEFLNLSLLTIHKHREEIRRKLGITNKRVNLSTYLRVR